jgi:excisionase family DNA binding protein
LTQETESFIDVDELAKFLKLKKQTAYHFVATQNIPHYRVGRLLRFKLSEIEEWMNRNKSEQLNVPYGELESI